MNKKEKQKILLPILIIVSLLIWIPNFQSNSKKSRNKISDHHDINSESKELVNLISKNSKIEPKKKSVYADWGRNPFMLKSELVFKEGFKTNNTESSDAQQLEDFVLMGIIWNQSKPSAIIDHAVVGLGAKVGSHTVVDIKQDKVILSNGLREIELTLTE